MMGLFLEAWYRKNKDGKVYSYRTIRLFVGVIAFSLPILVVVFSGEPELKSISVSYYSEARNTFVGFLFIVGAFLVSYRGHYTYESVVSVAAGFAAFVVAVAPTACKAIEPSQMCDGVDTTLSKESMHVIAAFIMFGILTYFCLFPFRRKAADREGIYALIRKWIYTSCGVVMILTMVGVLVFRNHYERTIFFAEWIMLWAFGIAWFTAGRIGDEQTENCSRTTKN